MKCVFLGLQLVQNIVLIFLCYTTIFYIVLEISELVYDFFTRISKVYSKFLNKNL